MLSNFDFEDSTSIQAHNSQQLNNTSYHVCLSESPPYEKKLYSLIKRKTWKDAFNCLDPSVPSKSVLIGKLGNFDQRSPLIDVLRQHDDESPVKLSSTVIALCKRLIDIGGKATLLFIDYSGHDTTLHHLCRRKIVDMYLMKKMVQVGGENWF